MKFHERCGKSISFSKTRDCAERKEGYDNGIVFSCKPLKKSQIFEVKIDAIEEKWAGSIRLGVTTADPNDLPYFRTVTDIHSSSEHNSMFWVCCGSKLFHGSQEFAINKSLYGLSGVSDIIGIQVRQNGQMHTYKNGVHVENVAEGLPVDVDLYVIVDIYGAVTKVSCLQDKVLSLKEHSRRVIQNIIKDENDIDDLNIPKVLKVFLKL
ncbi:neuralized-like protein 4 [Clytia hemisphaerica]|uniref:NHR domain-containing protein n=1 Tax=Clytia hemisphaerica TaxID=252671 RepID=A0A7M5UCE5_9CNID|eukprot:TCONS_00000422-protein